MTATFDPTGRAIPVAVDLTGPAGPFTFRFVLDTGTARTIVQAELARMLGYNLAAGRRVNMRSVTGGGAAVLLPGVRISALGVEHTTLPVVAHDFPATFTADGLLGLDFFRGRVLTIDFARGRLRAFSRRWWHLGR